jgi:ABC-type uncharacterized transport system fused permease/ATPase subunit
MTLTTLHQLERNSLRMMNWCNLLTLFSTWMMATRMASLITQNLCRLNRKQEEVDGDHRENTLQIVM